MILSVNASCNWSILCWNRHIHKTFIHRLTYTKLFLYTTLADNITNIWHLKTDYPSAQHGTYIVH